MKPLNEKSLRKILKLLLSHSTPIQDLGLNIGPKKLQLLIDHRIEKLINLLIHNSGYLTDLFCIKGIGPTTVENLLLKFRSVKRLKEASFEEWEKEIGTAKANIIKEWVENNKV